MSDYEPGTYAKGDVRKDAETKADAVALTFEGYKRVDSDEAPKSAEPDVETNDDDESDDDAVNGVGTLGTGTPSEASTPAPATPSAPSPSSVFGS